MPKEANNDLCTVLTTAMIAQHLKEEKASSGDTYGCQLVDAIQQALDLDDTRCVTTFSWEVCTMAT